MDWLTGTLVGRLVLPWSPRSTATCILTSINRLVESTNFNTPKIPPISVTHKIKLLWSVAVRGAPLANGLLLLAAVCGTPLANGKP